MSSCEDVDIRKPKDSHPTYAGLQHLKCSPDAVRCYLVADLTFYLVYLLVVELLRIVPYLVKLNSYPQFPAAHDAPTYPDPELCIRALETS